MPSHTNTAITSARPEQPLGTMGPQTGPGPGPAGDSGQQPQTPLDAWTRVHRPAAPKQADLEPNPHQNRPFRPTARPTHTHRPTALPHRHVPLPRPTPPAPGPSDTWAPCAPTPTSPPGAQVPRLQRHPACGPQGTIHQPRRRLNRHPINAKTHQPHRQYGPRKRHLAVPRTRGPDPDPDPARANVLCDAPRANMPGHGLPTGVPHAEGGTPAARPAAAEGSGSTRTLAGHMGSQPRPAPVRDGQTRAATPIKDDAAHQPHRPPSHNAGRPRCTRLVGQRRMQRDARSGKEQRCQQRT